MAIKPSADIPKGTLNSVLKHTCLEHYVSEMKYLVINQKGENGYGAYVPDLPGCVSAGETKEVVITLIQEAIEFHIDP